jgi:hypothetical protein
MAKLVPVEEEQPAATTPKGVKLIDASNVVYQGQRQNILPRAGALNYDEMTYSPTRGMSNTDLFLSGVGRGMTELYRGGQQVAGALTPEQYAQLRQRDAPLIDTTPGAVGNIVGQAAPFMAIPGTGITQAAVIGGAQGALTPVAPGESRGANTAIGAVLGGAGQAGVNMVSRAISGPTRYASAPRNKLAGDAKTLGYQLSPGQITDNPSLKSLEASFSDLPLTGRIERARAIANQANTNRIAVQAMGKTGTDAGADVAESALRTSGGKIGDIAKQTTVVLDNKFFDKLADADKILSMMPPSMPGRAGAARLLDDMVDLSVKGSIPGEQQQVMRSVLRAAAESGFKNPQSVPEARVQKLVQNALDDALYRSVPKSMVDDLIKARAEYAAAKAVEKANPVAGDVSGAALARTAKNKHDLLEKVGEISKAFKTDIANSGTPTRSAWNQAIRSPFLYAGTALGAGAGATQHDPMSGSLGGAFAGGLAGLLGPRAIQKMYYSPPVSAYLKHGLLGAPVPQVLTGAAGKLAVPAGQTTLADLLNQQ